MRKLVLVLLILISLLAFSASKTNKTCQGFIKWKLKIDEGISSNIAVGKDGTIYVVVHNDHLYAINPDGTVKNSGFFSIYDGEILSDPVIDDDQIVYIRVQEGEYVGEYYTYAINLDGTYHEYLSYPGDYTFGIDDSKYEIDDNGYLHSEGRFSWKFKINEYPWTEPSVGIDETIYVGAGNHVYAFNPDGSLRWVVELDYSVSSEEISIGEDEVAYVGSERGLYAIDPNGHIKWSFETNDKIRHVPLIGDDGTIYFDVGNRVYALSKDGVEKWDTKVDDDISFNLAMGIDGTIYAATTRYIYAISTSSKGLADSCWSKFHANQFNSRSIKTRKAVVVVNPVRLDQSLDVYIGDQYVGKTPVVYKSDDPIDSTITIKQDEKVVFEKHVRVSLGQIYGILDPIYNKPPEAPKALSPEASSVVSGSVSLSWRASFDPDGDKVSYDLYLGTSPNPPLFKKDLKSSSYTIIDLKPNTTYYWKVVAKDQYGLTSESSTMSFKTSSDGFVKWKVEIDGNPSGIAVGKDGAVYVSAYKQIKYNEYYGYVYAIGSDGAVKWKVKVDGMASFPVVGRDGAVYVGAGSEFYAIGLDGTVRWKVKFNEKTSFSVIEMDGNIYVGAGSYIYAFNPDGSVEWKIKVGAKGPSLTTGIDGTIYASAGSYVYALDPDGSVKWKVKTDSRVYSGPVVGKDGTIYVGLDGSIYVLNPDGTVKREIETKGPVKFFLVGEDGTIHAKVHGNGRDYIYFASPDGSVIQFHGSSLTKPAVGKDGTVYVGYRYNPSFLYAVIMAKKSIKWNIKVEGSTINTPVIGKDGNIYVGSGNCICSVSPNGCINWKSKIDAYINDHYNLAMGNDGTIYLEGWKYISGKRRYYIYAVSTSSGGLADSPWSKFQSDQYNSGAIKTKKAVLVVNPGHSKDLDVFINDKYFGKTPVIYESDEPIDATVTVKLGEKVLLERSVHVPTKRILGILDTLSNEPPKTPEIDSPKVGSVVSGNSVVLSWKPSEDPDGDQVLYDLYFGTSTDLSPIATDLLDFSYEVADLKASTTYYWKVVAKDSYGMSSESSVLHFRTSYSGFVKWNIKLDRQISSSLAIGKDGTVYMIVSNCCHDEFDYIYAIDSGGTVKWKTKLDERINSDPTVGRDGTIYVSTYKEKDCCSYHLGIYAINPDGSIKWKVRIGEWNLHERGNFNLVIGIDGTIYIGSDDGRVYAVDPKGFIKWKIQTGNSAIHALAVGMDGTIYAGSDGRYVYAIDPGGSIKWRFKTQGAVISHDVKSRFAIGGDGTIYVGSDDGNLYAIAPDGSMRWTVRMGSTVFSPVIGKDETIYIEADKKIHAINPDGTVKWEVKIGKGNVSNLLIGKDGTIYVGSYDGSLYALNADGYVKWKAEIGKASSYITMGKDGTIYMKYDKYIYAISTSSKGLADSPWPKPYADQFNSGVVRTRKAVLVVNPTRTKEPLDVYLDDQYIGKIPAVYKSDDPIDSTITIKQDKKVVFEKHVRVSLGQIYGILDPIYNKPPKAPQNRSPKINSIVSGTVELSWKPSSDPDGDIVRYDLYFGTSPKPPLLAENLEDTSYEITGLKPNTIYYWKVVAKDPYGIGSESPVWLFRTSSDGFIKRKIKIEGKISPNPAVGKDGTIYVSTNKEIDDEYVGYVYAIDPDGTVKWKIKLNGKASPPVVGEDGNIYVAIHLGDGDKLYALNPDGFVKWKFTFLEEITSNIAVGKDGTVYVGLHKRPRTFSGYGYSEICAINPDGSWKETVKYESDGEKIYSDIITGSDGTIYVGYNRITARGGVYALNPDGSVKWHFETLKFWLESGPVVGKNGMIYFVAEGLLYAINPDGKIEWEEGDARGHFATGEDGTVYVEVSDYSENYYLYAVNTDGSVKWKVKIDSEMVLDPVIGNHGTVYIGSNGKYVYAFRPDGTLKWRIKMDDEIRFIVEKSGNVYIGSRNYIYIIAISDEYESAEPLKAF